VTAAPGELIMVRECRARNALCRQVRALLAGSGLEIRELARELVISNPRDPHRGRIHVNYKTGEVSWTMTVWDYWGYLEGYGGTPGSDPGGDTAVTASRIISALRTGTGGPP